MDEEIKKCQEEIDTILNKYGFNYNFDMQFPQYNPQMLPETVQLAVLTILKEKVKIVPILVKKEPK